MEKHRGEISLSLDYMWEVFGRIWIFFEGNQSIKSPWERVCHCVINQNNTVIWKTFQVLMLGIITECMLSCFSHPTAIPWSVACQAPLSMWFSKQKYWSGLPCPSPGDLPDPRTEPTSLAIQADSSPSEPPGKPRYYH